MLHALVIRTDNSIILVPSNEAFSHEVHRDHGIP